MKTPAERRETSSEGDLLEDARSHDLRGIVTKPAIAEPDVSTPALTTLGTETRRTESERAVTTMIVATGAEPADTDEALRAVEKARSHREVENSVHYRVAGSDAVGERDVKPDNDPDVALRAAIVAALDAGDFDRVRALVAVLESSPRPAPVLTLASRRKDA